jgi:hypothetical protein
MRPSLAMSDVTISIDRPGDSIEWQSKPSRHFRLFRNHIMAKRKASPSTSSVPPLSPNQNVIDRSPATGTASSTSEEVLAVANDTAEGARRQPSYDEIAEAAYQRYLNRGAQHGQDTDDWLAAERDLSERRER